MKLTKGVELKPEFEIVRKPEHYEAVWERINKNLPASFNKFKDTDTASLLSKNEAFKVKKSNKALNLHIKSYFNDKIEEYQKEQEKYEKCPCLQLDYLEEINETRQFPDFKSDFGSKVPIINKCRMSQEEVLKEWKIKYKDKDAKELFDVIFNIIQFKNNYKAKINIANLSAFDNPGDFLFDDIANDEDMIYGSPGVIGGGIRSTILNYLNPEYFPGRFKMGIFSLFFLSDQWSKAMPSKTSEFIMIDERPNPLFMKLYKQNYKMEYNYFYPYDIFALFSLRIYRLLKKWADGLGYKFYDSYRYYYVSAFYDHVFEINKNSIQTMTGQDVIEDDHA